MKHNDVVTLRNPQKDEMRFDGRPLPFRVLEWLDLSLHDPRTSL